jgi:hypothetical protein
MGETVAGAVATLRHNEKLKLLATALNNLALAFAVGGFVAPVLKLSVPGDTSALPMFFWLALAVFLHGAGQFVLGRLV